jgi:hypothetical protein
VSNRRDEQVAVAVGKPIEQDKDRTIPIEEKRLFIILAVARGFKETTGGLRAIAENMLDTPRRPEIFHSWSGTL